MACHTVRMLFAAEGQVMRRYFTRRRILMAVAALVIAFVAFEVVVRLVPPDSVQYTIQTVSPSGPGSTISGTITDPATVARWRATVTAQPDKALISAYLERWQGAGCAGGIFLIATYRFTWRGFPMEVVSPGPSCAAGYQVSSGGIPDWYTYTFDFPQP